MLAVASQQAVYIFCPRRITYVDRLRPASKVPKWDAIAKIDVTSLGRLTITGIVWQSDHTLTVAASNLVLGFNGTLQSQHAVSGSHLIELAIEQAGSLRDSDPEVILQCLIWDKVGIALEIFTNIAHAIDNLVSSEPLQVKSIEWERVEILQARWDSQKGKVSVPFEWMGQSCGQLTIPMYRLPRLPC